ncbi:c-type cytochrome [uncultured Zhongshania sp.]|uniref:c-type cytochrome n=1 Tax=uncultured Zhongshania sp. TaxID=1642288 RepID=UPI0025FC6A7F|nr:c-type cytochrome [uncultured Zhongshania sp.]
MMSFKVSHRFATLLPLGLVIALVGCGPSPSTSATATTETASAAPSSRSLMPSDPALKSLYIQSCYGCHSTGVAGAPRSGNQTDWAPRLQKGMDVLLSNTVNGLNSMPPKGMCMGCSEEDFRNLIVFLSGQSE